MTPAPDRLDTLLQSVSEGHAIDWLAEDTHALDAASRSQVRALRDVSRILEFNRALQRSPEPLGATATGSGPRRWGSLLLLERLGAGASGEVHRAWDPALEREVALKLLLPERGRGPGPLLEEARALARIHAPEVVGVHGIGEEQGQVGVWMEFLRGEDLAQRLARSGALPIADVTRIGAAVCRALTAVHAAGVVHCDLKPANLMLTDDGRVVLTDFGLGQRPALEDDDAVRFSGTPMFMAPERLAGEPASPRGDLYALGVTLWCALTGHPPFPARTLAELRAQAPAGPPQALLALRPDAPAALVRVIEQAMAADPARRFASAATMGEALAAASAAPPTRARRHVAWLAAAAVAVVALAAWWALRPQPRVAVLEPPPAPAPAATFDLEASLLRRNDGARTTLANGDRIRPGDQLALEFRASRPAHVYVLNEDEQGEAYLLFPQPLFDLTNPLPADSTVLLPGAMGGQPSAWTVTSRGGREHFLVVASLDPVPELEAELTRLPAPEPGRAPRYAAIPVASMERLRGVGGVSTVPGGTPAHRAGVFDRLGTLAGRERQVSGVWVRQVTLENPVR